LKQCSATKSGQPETGERVRIRILVSVDVNSPRRRVSQIHPGGVGFELLELGHVSMSASLPASVRRTTLWITSDIERQPKKRFARASPCLDLRSFATQLGFIFDLIDVFVETSGSFREDSAKRSTWISLGATCANARSNSLIRRSLSSRARLNCLISCD
jgi:hypothetical protein